MRIRSRLFLLALAVGGLSPRGRAAPAEEPVVIAVAACDGYADLKKQLRWVGTQVGNPTLDGFVESFIMMATQFKGLAGLDVGRPAGIVVTTREGAPAVQGFVPVKDAGRLLESLQAVIGPVGEPKNGLRRVMLPSGVALEIAERDGWAVVAPEGMTAAAGDPATVLATLVDRYSVGVRLFPARMPAWMREQLKLAIRQMAATAPANQPVDEASLTALVDGLSGCESLDYGLALDESRDCVALETRLVATPGSAGARALAAGIETPLTVGSPGATADGRPAARGHSCWKVTDAKAVLDMLATSQPADGDPVARTGLGLLRDLAEAMLETGTIDASATVDTAAADASRPIPDVTIGMRIKDGPALEAAVKRRLADKGGLPAEVSVAFDAGTVGTAKLHRITIDLPDTEAAGKLGDKVEATLAIAPGYAFLLLGGDVKRRLERALAASGRPDATAKPFADFELSVAPLLAYAARMMEAVAPGRPETDVVESAAQEAGARPALVRMQVRPIERGAAYELSVDAAAIQALAGLAAARNPGSPQRQAPGPARPPAARPRPTVPALAP